MTYELQDRNFRDEVDAGDNGVLAPSSSRSAPPSEGRSSDSDPSRGAELSGGVASNGLSRTPGSRDRSLVYAIANQKGGVGKTTTAINLAASLAQAGERVLLIDMDSQANATHGLGLRVPRGSPCILEVLLGESGLRDIIMKCSVPGLDVAPSSPETAGTEVLLANAEAREFRLKQALAKAALPGSEYSYVFIDCPPSLGLLTVNSLVAAEQVIIPVQTEYYALEGLAQLMSTIVAVKERLNPGLRVAGLVLTMVDSRTTLARQVEREIRTHFPRLAFETVVPRNIRLAEAPSYGIPVCMLDPHCAGSDAYFDLALEVIGRG